MCSCTVQVFNYYTSGAYCIWAPSWHLHCCKYASTTIVQFVLALYAEYDQSLVLCMHHPTTSHDMAAAWGGWDTQGSTLLEGCMDWDTMCVDRQRKRMLQEGKRGHRVYNNMYQSHEISPAGYYVQKLIKNHSSLGHEWPHRSKGACNHCPMQSIYPSVGMRHWP